MKLTNHCSYREQLDSEWGRIPYLEWCQREAARINKSVGREVAIVFEKGGGCHVQRLDRQDEAEVKDE